MHHLVNVDKSTSVIEVGYLNVEDVNSLPARTIRIKVSILLLFMS